MTFEQLKNHQDYEISNEFPFTIRRISNGREISEWFDVKGYVVIKLNNKPYKKHRIIAEQFIENDDPTTKTQVDHINHDKSDYRIENLRWISNKENCRNKSKHSGIEYTFVKELNEETTIEINEYKCCCL